MDKDTMKELIEYFGLLDNEIRMFVNAASNYYGIKVNLGPDFCCYPMGNELYYSLFVTEKCSKTFMDRVHKEYPDIEADEFLWSLLHEVGHLITYDDITDEEWEMIERIKKIPNLSDEVYYELTDEYMATQWAAYYMRDNSDYVERTWKKIREIILHIYTLCGFTDNT